MAGIIFVENNDIVIRDGVLVMLTGIDTYAQKMRDNLRFQFQEWSLDPEWGTPWLDLLVDEEIKTAAPYTNLVKSIILADEETVSVSNVTTEFDGATRTLTISAAIQSVYGYVDLQDSITIVEGSI